MSTSIFQRTTPTPPAPVSGIGVHLRRTQEATHTETQIVEKIGSIFIDELFVGSSGNALPPQWVQGATGGSHGVGFGYWFPPIGAGVSGLSLVGDGTVSSIAGTDDAKAGPEVLHTNVPVSADYAAELEFNFTESNAAAYDYTGVEIILRADPADTSTFIVFSVTPRNPPGMPTTSIIEIADGDALDSFYNGPELLGPHKIRAEVRGDQMTAFLDGVPVLTGTTTILAAGRTGFGLRNDAQYGTPPGATLIMRASHFLAQYLP